MIKYSDSHFHSLLLKEKNLDFSLCFRNMELGIDIASHPDDFEKRDELLKGYDNIFMSTGVGPWFVEDVDHNKSAIGVENCEFIEKNIIKNASSKRCKFIGEIGLDYFNDYGPAILQKEVFNLQLECAKRLKFSIITHIRASFDDTYDILKEYDNSKKGIIHCFSGDKGWAKKFLDLGYMIAFGGAATFKKNYDIQDAATYVPIDMLLFETDAPYLAPVPLRGTPNMPSNTPLIIEFISNLRKESKEDLAEKSTENLRRLL